MKELPIYGRRNGMNGQLIGYTMIDDDDFEKCSQYNWNLSPDGYVWRSAGGHNGKRYLLHRLIMNFPKGRVIDHKDHDKLNNQKSNLRICDDKQNGGNRVKETKRITSSKFKGVTLRKKRRTSDKWLAAIKCNGEDIYLGIHETEVEAARAYNEAATKYFGEFACLNEIPNQQN